MKKNVMKQLLTVFVCASLAACSGNANKSETCEKSVTMLNLIKIKKP